MDAELSADQTTELHVQMDKLQDSDLVTSKPTETPESNEIAESLVEEVKSAEKEEIAIVGEEPKKHLDAPKPSPVHDESISDVKQGGITETDAVENSTTLDVLVKEEKTEVVEASPIGEITGEIEKVELVKEEKPKVAVTESVPVAATTEEPKDEKPEEVEVMKEENKSGLPDTTPVVATEVIPVSATAEEEKEIELPKEETVNSVIETVESEKTEVAVTERVPVAETIEEPKHEKTEEAEIVKEENKSGFPDVTPVAATDEKKEIELPKEETVSSVTGTVEETPNPEFRQEEKETKLGTVTEVLKETIGAVVASEIGEGLPEKKRRALGDHLEEEKAKDSVNPVTEESTRDLNMGDIAKTEVDEKKIEKETATEVTCKDKEESEKPVERELVEPVKEATAKGNSRNILSKVKHQIVKVKKAIIGKSPSSKNMPVENRDELKVK